MSRVTEAVDAVKVGRERTLCKTCKFLESLTDKRERAELEAVIASDASHRFVAAVLTHLEFPITYGAIVNHRDNHVSR